MKLKKLGLSYMGSKRRLSLDIVSDILKKKPNTKYIYDLFGGGGAISFTFLQLPTIKKVIYNDIDTGVVELIKYVVENGITDEMYKWVDRETFHRHREDPTWYGGFIKTIWSFGSNHKSYLYGKDKEHLKELTHNYVVYDDKNAKEELENILGVKIPEIKKPLLNSLSIHTRRKEFAKVLDRLTDDNNKDIIHKLIYKDKHTARNLLIHLQKLEALSLLNTIKTKDKLTLLNNSYDEVVIDTPINETVIYLDPPYINRERYKKEVNNIKLKNWIHRCKYPVFLSEVDNFYRLNTVAEYKHRYTLSSTNNKYKITEKLFWNGK